MQTVGMKTITRVARVYLGMSQNRFSKAVHLTQPDLCEMEQTPEAFGSIEKYKRVSAYLGISVDTLLRNDFSAIPMEFFEKFPPRPFRKVGKKEEQILGRTGEEWVFHREQERLMNISPALAKMALPIYKMDVNSPGFDILSFTDDGIPFAIEVKTSAGEGNVFRMSPNEYHSADAIAKTGQQYVVTRITNFGTSNQKVEDIPYERLQRDYRIQPASYQCLRLPDPQPVTGIVYHRLLLGMQQKLFAERLDVEIPKLCGWESGSRRAPAEKYLQMSDILGAPVDNLLKMYPCGPGREAAL